MLEASHYALEAQRRTGKGVRSDQGEISEEDGSIEYKPNISDMYSFSNATSFSDFYNMPFSSKSSEFDSSESESEGYRPEKKLNKKKKDKKKKHRAGSGSEAESPGEPSVAESFKAITSNKFEVLGFRYLRKFDFVRMKGRRKNMHTFYNQK